MRKYWSIKSEGKDWWLVHDEIMHGIHIKELSFEGFKPYVVNKIVWNHDKTQRGVIMEVFDWGGTDQVDYINKRVLTCRHYNCKGGVKSVRLLPNGSLVSMAAQRSPKPF